MYLKLEQIYLDTLELIITATFENKDSKLISLKISRVKIEVLKRFIRNMLKLNIIEEKNYLHSELLLQEISKMINHWIKFQINNPP